MSYKLYNFKNVQDPGFANKLDEQIRLLCDVLYNRREIYPGQLTSPTDPFWFKQALWWAFPGGGIPPGRTLIAGTGTTLTRTPSAADIELSTADELASPVSSATSGTSVSYRPPAPLDYSTGISPSDPFNFGLYLFVRIKLTSITNLRFRVTMGNQSNTNTDNPWTTSATAGGLAFNFLPASSANWHTVGKIFTVATGTLSFDYDTLVPVVANQIYNLEIVVRGTDTNRIADFYIDGTKVYTELGNSRYSTYLNSASEWNLVLYPTENVVKRLAVFGMVWGRRPTVTVIPDPKGYESY